MTSLRSGNLSGTCFSFLLYSPMSLSILHRCLAPISISLLPSLITNPTEIHIKNNQLELTQENRQIYIPIEDLSMITTIESNIRLSTMDLSILANNHVSLTTLDNKYSPTALVLPFEGNSRQSQLIHQQVQFSKEEYNKLWFQIIKQKISNQSRVLSLLGCPGAEKIGTYAQQMKKEDIDSSESLAAKDYSGSFL